MLETRPLQVEELTKLPDLITSLPVLVAIVLRSENG